MYTVATGINNLDEIVGYYQDSTGTHGFYRDSSGNLTYPINVQNAIYTAFHGINDGGEIVGVASTRSGDRGFVMRLPDQITSFEVSGAYITSANGINNSGQISGTFNDFRGSGMHGFIAQLRQ
jgi:uncharacterized membrane protein